MQRYDYSSAIEYGQPAEQQKRTRAAQARGTTGPPLTEEAPTIPSHQVDKMVNTRRPKRNAGAPSKDPTPVKPASKTPAKPAAKPKADDKSGGKQVRVWWAPTKDKKRSGYSGMYWPATFIRKSGQNMIQVKYDNGELEELDMASVSPAEVPMKFGGETTRLEVGEFCEVFNNSTTDPAAWVGRVAKVNKKSFSVEYPFHDAEPELVKDDLIRRARVWTESDKSWKFILPFQTWPDGEITDPWELKLCTEKDLKKALKDGPSTAEEAAATPAATKVAKVAAKDTPKKAATPAGTPGGEAKKRGRPKKTDEQKAEDAAKKKARKAEADAAAAAAMPTVPAMSIPALPAGVPVMSGMPTGVAPNMQALQGLLSAPNMLPLLQTLLQSQGGARPALPPGMNVPMAMAPAVPKTIPTPPEAIEIPPLPAPLEEDEPLVEPTEEKAAEPAVAEDGKKKRRKKKAMPLIQVPKKARSAYILFSMDFRKNMPPDMDFNEATRQAAAKWKDADEATKKKFEDLANSEREDYAKRQADYLERKKVLDGKLAARIAKQQAHSAAIKAHEDAKMKQLELNQAYHAACAAAGVAPQPVPQVPGADAMTLQASTSANAEDAITTQINKLEMEKARKHILKYYHEDAFYMLVDIWRRDSPKLNDALTSAKCHVFSKLRADWKAFMIGTFGKDVMDSMLRKEGDAPPTADE
eukprot:jgi/Tetstr1/447717/TSEL_000020.t2